MAVHAVWLTLTVFSFFKRLSGSGSMQGVCGVQSPLSVSARRSAILFPFETRGTVRELRPPELISFPNRSAPIHPLPITTNLSKKRTGHKAYAVKDPALRPRFLQPKRTGHSKAFAVKERASRPRLLNLETDRPLKSLRRKGSGLSAAFLPIVNGRATQ
jgi:hypothetical protein